MTKQNRKHKVYVKAEKYRKQYRKDLQRETGGCTFRRKTKRTRKFYRWYNYTLFGF